jgi:hypothetical protein
MGLHCQGQLKTSPPFCVIFMITINGESYDLLLCPFWDVKIAQKHHPELLFDQMDCFTL